MSQVGVHGEKALLGKARPEGRGESNLGESLRSSILQSIHPSVFILLSSTLPSIHPSIPFSPESAILSRLPSIPQSFSPFVIPSVHPTIPPNHPSFHPRYSIVVKRPERGDPEPGLQSYVICRLYDLEQIS